MTYVEFNIAKLEVQSNQENTVEVKVTPDRTGTFTLYLEVKDTKNCFFLTKAGQVKSISKKFAAETIGQEQVCSFGFTLESLKRPWKTKIITRTDHSKIPDDLDIDFI